MIGTPKYFDNLHVAVSAICGSPRIVNIKEGQTTSDKYKNIPQEEWESAILNWLSFKDDDKAYVQVLDNYTYVVGGKASSKETLVKTLRDLATTIENLEE